jgi:hypothetical protein
MQESREREGQADSVPALILLFGVDHAPECLFTGEFCDQATIRLNG